MTMLKVMKRQIVYQGNFDPERSRDELWKTFKIYGYPKGTYGLQISNDVDVMITPKSKLLVSWSKEEEKIRGLEILKRELIPSKGEKEIVLTPLTQNLYNIPYPSPKDLRLMWCKEGVQYFSLDQGALIKNAVDEIRLDYVMRLDFDSLQRRAEILYPHLPKEWQKKLAPLFTDKAFMRMKTEWADVFVRELNRLMWATSRSQ